MASAEFSISVAMRSPGWTPKPARAPLQPARHVGHLGGRVLGAADVEVLGVGVALQPTPEQVDDRLPLAADPDLVGSPVPVAIDLISVYSSKPAWPISRPMPLCL